MDWLKSILGIEKLKGKADKGMEELKGFVDPNLAPTEAVINELGSLCSPEKSTASLAGLSSMNFCAATLFFSPLSTIFTSLQVTFSVNSSEFPATEIFSLSQQTATPKRSRFKKEESPRWFAGRWRS